MKRQLLLGIWIMAVICPLAWGQTQPPQISTLPVGSAIVAELKGKVSLRSPQGDFISPKLGITLMAESTVETAKGSAVLNLEDGSQVLIKPNSRVVLKSPGTSTGFYLSQWLGKIIVKAQKRMGNTPSFRMGTPTAVISVRGTRFEVEVKDKSRTSVSVYEGLVEVRGVKGEPVLLGPGFSTSVQENHPPEPPAKVELPEGGARHSRRTRGGGIQGDPMQPPGSIGSSESSPGPGSERDVTE